MSKTLKLYFIIKMTIIVILTNSSVSGQWGQLYFDLLVCEWSEMLNALSDWLIFIILEVTI